MSPTGAEVVRADPAFRRRFLGVVLLLAAAGAAALVALHFHLEATRELARDDPARAIEHMLWLLEVVSAVTAASLILFGLYGVRLAARVYRAQRYPLAEQRVLRDTPVTIGRAAQRRALAIGATSTLLIAAGIVFPYAINRIVGQLTEVEKKLHPAGTRAAPPATRRGRGY